MDEALQKACRQPVVFHPRNYLAAKTLPLGAHRKLFLEIGEPAAEGRAGYLEETLEFPYTASLRSFLPKSHNYQNHASPVDPPPHEKTRRWKGPFAASFTATAKTLPNGIFFGDVWWTTSGLSYIVRLMQRTATMWTPLLPLYSGKIRIDGT